MTNVLKFARLYDESERPHRQQCGETEAYMRRKCVCLSGGFELARIQKVSWIQAPTTPYMSFGMIRPLVILSGATAAAAQFNHTHTQYSTSPSVYPSRESIMITIQVYTNLRCSKHYWSWWMGGSARESAGVCGKADSQGESSYGYWYSITLLYSCPTALQRASRHRRPSLG
jgi:hypothetical protein